MSTTPSPTETTLLWLFPEEDRSLLRKVKIILRQSLRSFSRATGISAKGINSITSATKIMPLPMPRRCR